MLSYIEIWTSANSSQLNFITIDDGARAEIQAALVQGLEVTVHENPITVNGWQGSGYEIIDPEYGVGAYKISGGASGGFLDDVVVSSIITLMGYSIAPIFFSGGLAFGPIALAVLAAVNFGFWVHSMRHADSYQDFNTNNLVTALGISGGYALLKLGANRKTIPLIVFFEGLLLAWSAP